MRRNKFNRTYMTFPRMKHQLKERCCNLCDIAFHPRTVFDRYCVQCREQEELLKFSDWLPQIENPLTTCLQKREEFPWIEKKSFLMA